MDHEFGSLSGIRIVRIATHPDFHRMGYGTRAMELLMDYYSGRICTVMEQVSTEGPKPEVIKMEAGPSGLLHEVIAPRSSLPPLLSELSERAPEKVDYIGVSFGLTEDLLRCAAFCHMSPCCMLTCSFFFLRFWSKKNSFVPVYVRQTPVNIICLVTANPQLFIFMLVSE